ncbi:MAG: thioesterase [Anaerolineales bacterium]|nr:thioesterase [Anaerolineales bacterium]
MQTVNLMVMMTEATKKTDKWFLIPRPNPNCKLRLFCFPYAGAGATVFREWSKYLPGDIEICAVQPPGRESRVREAPYTQVEPLVASLLETMPARLDKPFAFFGHSLGALVAFVLTRELRRKHNILPKHLFVSARSAPQSSRRESPFYALPDAAFLEKVRQLGGMDASILENAELMELITPILRADFQMNETYTYVTEHPLACPISAFRGAKDDLMTYDEVAAWSEQTTGKFRLRTLPGGHFFINGEQNAFWQVLAYDLEQISRQV